jgi:hypothetical protein
MGYRACAVRTEQQMGLGVIGTRRGVGPSCVIGCYVGPSWLLYVLWVLPCYWMYCGSFRVIRCYVGPFALLDVLWVLQGYWMFCGSFRVIGFFGTFLVIRYSVGPSV